MDKFKSPLLHYGFLVIFGLGVLVLGFLLFGSGVRANPAAQPRAAGCQVVAGVQVITLTDQGFNPSRVTVKRCAELIFVAGDNSLHDPAFGQHDHHDHSLPYEERTLSLGQTNSVLLANPGTHLFHDHLNDDLTGQVVVK